MPLLRNPGPGNKHGHVCLCTFALMIWRKASHNLIGYSPLTLVRISPARGPASTRPSILPCLNPWLLHLHCTLAMSVKSALDAKHCIFSQGWWVPGSLCPPRTAWECVFYIPLFHQVLDTFLHPTGTTWWLFKGSIPSIVELPKEYGNCEACVLTSLMTQGLPLWCKTCCCQPTHGRPECAWRSHVNPPWLSFLKQPPHHVSTLGAQKVQFQSSSVQDIHCRARDKLFG